MGPPSLRQRHTGPQHAQTAEWLPQLAVPLLPSPPLPLVLPEPLTRTWSRAWTSVPGSVLVRANGL